MTTFKDASEVAMHITYGCLVVPVQVELYDNTVLHIREEILAKVQEEKVKGVIIDLSGVSVIDSFSAGVIRDTARAVALLGTRAVISGLRPDTVASLVDLNIYFEGTAKVSSLEEGLRLLQPAAGRR
jgi:rsbT antagonist protein RsbS